MEESKDKYGLSPSDVRKLKMGPPEYAWGKLEAELDKKLAVQAVGVSKPLQFAYYSVVILIAFILSYSYLAPVKVLYLSDDKRLNESKITERIPVDSYDNDKREVITNLPLKNTSSSIDRDSKHTNPASSKVVRKAASVPALAHNTGENHILGKSAKAITGSKTNLPPYKKSLTATNQLRQVGNENKQVPGDRNGLNKKQTTTPSVVGNETYVDKTQDDVEGEHNAESAKPVLGNINSFPSSANIEVKKPVIAKSDSLKSIRSVDSLLKREGRVSHWSVAAFYSPNYSRNHLSENGSVPSENVMEYYDHEKPAYSFSAGITIGYDLTPHWSLATGGIYSTLSYVSDLSVIYAGYDAGNALHYRYPTSCGTIEIPDENQVPLKKGDSLGLNTTCSQVVRFITIPLTVRYKISINRLSVYAYAGVSANYAIQSRARLSLAQGSETTIINNVDGLKKMNYGYLLGAGVQYNFNNGLGIFIEPAYRGSVNSLTENISVNCYPYSFGLNTGISLHF